MKRQLAVVSVLLALACQDSGTDPNKVSQVGPNAAIIDGGFGGNSHFFWLNPQWTVRTFTGTANQTMSPTIRICRWDGTSCVGPDVAVLSRADGAIAARENDYTAVWNTFTANPQLDELFRARVYLGNLEVGARDLKFVTKSVFGTTPNDNPDWAPVHYDPNDVGSNRPSGKYTLRFRLEDGVLREALGLGDEECTDCAEGSVSTTSTVTTVIETPSEDAAAVFEPGSVAQDINVLVEKLDVPCLPTNAQQYPACYRFVAEPDIEFTIPATVEVCVEQVDNFAVGQLQLYKVKERRVGNEWVPTGPVEPLENVPDRFINCGVPQVIGAIARKYPRLASGLRALTRPLGRVIGPRVAWAEDEGRGGRTGEFSRIGWTRTVNIAKSSGDNQSGATGATLNPVVAHLTPLHHDIHTGGAPPAAGVPVSFQLIGPDNVGGPIGTATSTSDGSVSIPLALGNAPGTYRLVVVAPGTNLADRNPETGELIGRAVPEVVFTATATSPVIVSLLGDLDNFGYGVGNAIPCVFYDRSDPVADLGIFDRELSTAADRVESWTHDFRSQIPSTGYTATDVLIEIREYFSDIPSGSSTIVIDGATFNFPVNGVSQCNTPIVQTFRFTGAAAAFANDGVINIQFNEGFDDIAIDYARVTVTAGTSGIILGRMAIPTLAPRPLTASEINAVRAAANSPAPKSGLPAKNARLGEQRRRGQPDRLKR